MNKKNYYDQVLEAYDDLTWEESSEQEFPDWEPILLKHLNKPSKILDLGCGDGHSSEIFLQHGHDILAVDGSKHQCQQAKERLHRDVFCLRFDEIDFKEEFDAIWACCSLLHVPRKELPDIFSKLHQALKPGGFFYSSFKEGDFDGISSFSGNQFTEMNIAHMEELIGEYTDLMLIDIERTPFQNKDDQHWIHFIVKKQR